MSSDRIFEVRAKPPILKNSTTAQPLNPSFLLTAESINNSSFTEQSTSNSEDSEYPKCLRFLVEKKLIGLSPLTWISIFVILLIVLVIFGASMLDNEMGSSEEKKNVV